MTSYIRAQGVRFVFIHAFQSMSESRVADPSPSNVRESLIVIIARASVSMIFN